MPKAIDPKATYDFVLESDRDKPEAERPTFVCRYLTGREQSALGRLVDGLNAGTNQEAAISDFYQGIAVGISTWRNMHDGEKPMPFNRGLLSDIVGIDEAIELMTALISAGRLDSEKKDESGSAS